MAKRTENRLLNLVGLEPICYGATEGPLAVEPSSYQPVPRHRSRLVGPSTSNELVDVLTSFGKATRELLKAMDVHVL